MDVKGPSDIAREANCKSSEAMLLTSNRPLRSKGHVISEKGLSKGMLKRNAAHEVSRFSEKTRSAKISLMSRETNAKVGCGGQKMTIYDVASWLLCGRALWLNLEEMGSSTASGPSSPTPSWSTIRVGTSGMSSWIVLYWLLML